MTRIISFIFALVVFFSFALPTYAADAVFFGPIVPNGTNGQPNCNCPGSAPDYGCVLQTLQNGINFVISIGFMLLILYIALAGFQFITSGGSAEARSAAKKRIMNVLVGILVVLSAWLIVDFVMKTLYGEDGRFGPWHAILREEGGENLCLEKTAKLPPLPGVTGGGPSTGPGEPGTVNTGSACPGTAQSCVSLPPEVNCEARGCKVDSGLKAALARINPGFGWTVTEAYPPSRTHRAACHNNGTCVDAAFRPKEYSVDKVVAFNNAGEAQGLRLVFETDNCTLRDQVRARGVEAYCKADGGGYEAISGTHFSVYAK